MRFFAALAVVTFHFAHFAYGPGVPAPLRGVLANGYVGVDFFFVLSGFILAYTYMTPSGSMRGTAWAFYVARVARIYPLYLVALVIAWEPYLWSHDPSATPLRTVVAGLTLTQSWLPTQGLALDPPAWSLSVEACFYALFPLFVPLIGRMPVRRLLPVALLCAVAGLLIPVAYMLGTPGGIDSGTTSGGDAFLAMALMPIAHLHEFLIGMLAGRLFVLAPPRHPARWAARGGGVALAVLAATPSLPFPLLKDGILDLPIAAFLVGMAGRQGILASRPLLALGEASFAVYILHYPLYLILCHVLGADIQRAAQSPAFFAVYLALVIALALASGRYIETPARRALRRWGTPRHVSPLPRGAPALAPAGLDVPPLAPAAPRG